MLGVRATKIEQYNMDQQCAIKFCMKLGEGTKQTFDKVIQVFDKDAMTRLLVFLCYK